MSATRASVTDVLLPAGALVAAILAWWAFVAVTGVPAYVLPSPSAVATRLATDPALYLRSAAATFRKVAIGGATGACVGFAAAVVVEAVPWARRTLYPFLVTARVLPKIAVAPVLLIYLGTGFGTTVLFVALVSFFPMVVNTAAGLARLPDRCRDLLASVDAGPVRSFLAVRLPYALPDVFAGLKQTAVLGVVGAVVAEWVIGAEGLGFLILVAAENVRPDVVLAAVALLVVEALALYGALVWLQRRLVWESTDE